MRSFYAERLSAMSLVVLVLTMSEMASNHSCARIYRLIESYCFFELVDGCSFNKVERVLVLLSSSDINGEPEVFLYCLCKYCCEVL